MNRILHVIGSLNCGGSQMMVMNLYRNIDREKVQFDFIIDKKDELFFAKEIESLGGKIYILPEFKGYNIINYCLSWISFFKEHKEYKIIHSHVRSTASIFLSIAKKYGLYTIIHSHSTSNGKGINSYVKSILQYPLRYQANFFFACSKQSGEWLFGDRIVDNPNFKIIKNAIDVNRFSFNESIRNKYRKDLELENKYVIGHVGRFHESKNHKFLIDVFAEVYKMNCDTRLMLIGDGPLKNEIQDQIKRLGLQNAVYLLGARSDVPELMQAMDIFTFPSLYEGLPVGLIEAQASGTPIIASNCITSEVNVTRKINFVSLEEKIEVWCSMIERNLYLSSKQVDISLIKEAGYDVNENARWLQKFYLDIIS